MARLSFQKFIDKINSNKKMKDALKESAITGLIRIEHNNGAHFFSNAENLSEAFIWDVTIEGKDFWVNINNEIFEIDTI